MGEMPGGDAGERGGERWRGGTDWTGVEEKGRCFA